MSVQEGEERGAQGPLRLRSVPVRDLRLKAGGEETSAEKVKGPWRKAKGREQ